MTVTAAPVKLPLWRLCGGILIFAAMVAVLLLLAPVYLDNLRLGSYMRYVAFSPNAAATSEETMRSEILSRAKELRLPVQPGEIQISRAGDKMQIQAKYAVVKNFYLYQVDLHFHPAVTAILRK